MTIVVANIRLLAETTIVVIDECFLVLVHTPLFTFVRPLVLLIFTNLTCFVCFVLIRSLHHKLTKGANGHEES
jgi:hypothetical protein